MALSEDSKKRITEKKLSLVRNGKNDIVDYVNKICSLRPKMYETRKEEWQLKLKEIGQNLEKENYFLFIGRFSSGKSSFINSLLGSDLLPTASAPCTSVVTEVRFVENYGSKKGRIVYQGGTVEEKTQDELQDIIKGKRNVETGAIHHIELNLDIYDNNQIGENISDSLKSLVGKVVLVDCPGFDSPYKFPEEILYEYIEKSSFTFYLLPSNDFGGIREVNRLTAMHKRTATLIPLISKSDLIVDDDEKEKICEDFDKILSGKFDNFQPIFISTFKYKEYVEKYSAKQEDIEFGKLSDEEKLSIDKLLSESGIIQVFSEMGRISKDSELNKKKLDSVLFDFNEVVDKLYKAAVDEENHWFKELNRAGYNIESKQYKAIEDNDNRINEYISEQADKVGKELKNNILDGLTYLLTSSKTTPDQDAIKKVFEDNYQLIQDKYNPIWSKRFKEYFDGLCVCCSMDDPEFKIPNLSSLPTPGSYIPRGVIEGISKSGFESILLSVIGAGLITASATIVLFETLALVGGIALLAFVGVKNIPTIKDGIEAVKEKDTKKVQRKLSELIDNEHQLNFEGTIEKALTEYRDEVYNAFTTKMESSVGKLRENYRESQKIKDNLERIQIDLNQQVK